MIEPRNSKKFARALMKWYDRDQRLLPWRENQDPYRVWVSEIMLQQTQVKTVIPYFNRWIKSFPTLKTLASAPESKVLKHWEGLGYYSRARNLHKAARQVLEEYDGCFPDTPDGIRALPGVGRYTAGAILSIAFDQQHPVVDGNVKRVLSRWFRLKENGATPKSENKLWELAASLVPRKRPGDFNQALMELGATICLPKNPLCLTCPVTQFCEAAQHQVQDKFPPPKKRVPSRKIEVSAAVIERGGRTFIQKRPVGGLMGGLWEFPGGKLEKGETPEDALLREIQEELGVQILIREKLMTVRHSYTQFRVTLHVFRCTLPRGRIRATQCDDWKWVKQNQLEDFTYPAANVKIVRHLAANGRKP